MSRAVVDSIYKRLWAVYGPQAWWPGDSPLEVVVGAVLTQNTAWRNVERAIANLREAGLLDFWPLHGTSVEELAELIRPAGYYRLKARRLANLLAMIGEKYGGDLEAMAAAALERVRADLLGVNGVGPETADSILLYALKQPTFVVDAYTARVLKRHAWIEPEADYYAIKEFFEQALSADTQHYNEYHALLVRVGNQHCRRTPKCEGCPLEGLLPEGGPVTHE